MKKVLTLLAAAILVCAVAIMSQPTFVMVFGTDGGGHFDRPTRWFELLLVGYAEFLPVVSLLCALVMIAGLTTALLRGTNPGWIAVPGTIATLLLVFFGYNPTYGGYVAGAGQLVAPLLGAASVLCVIVAALHRRENRAAASAD